MDYAKLFKGFAPLLKTNAGFHSYTKDTVLELNPEAVLRPKNKFDLLEIVRICQKNLIPYTAIAAQTSVTGASVSDKGILISLEKLNKILSPITKTQFGYSLKVESGCFLKDIKEFAKQNKLYFPPDPTSFNEILIGGALATNATGEDSYHYGSTRNYILGLEYIDYKGNFSYLKRETNPLKLPKSKNLAGLCLDLETIDYFIGSEGSLGIITEIDLLLIEKPKPYLAFLIFLNSELDALNLVLNLNSKKDFLKLICLEYMDLNATNFMRINQKFKLPKNTYTLYIKSELAYKNLDLFFNSLKEIYIDLNIDLELLEQSLIAKDYLELKSFRELRHIIPASINEIAQKHKLVGGGKVSTDSWVPLKNLKPYFEFLNKKLNQLAIAYAIFGHLGNGHPHLNLMPQNKLEYNQALSFLKETMQVAVSLGGGACGEHGLGKLKKYALNIQWDQEQIAKMSAIKKLFDPNFLCAPKNIFN